MQVHRRFSFKHLPKVQLRLHISPGVSTAGILTSAKTGAGVPGYMGVFGWQLLLKEHVYIMTYLHL